MHKFVARQVAKNVSYTGGFLGMLGSLAAVLYHSLLVLYLPSWQDLKLVYFLLLITKRLLVVEMDSIYTNMINAIEYRNGRL